MIHIAYCLIKSILSTLYKKILSFHNYRFYCTKTIIEINVMQLLKDYLTKDHKECDSLLAKLENKIHSKEIETAKKDFEEFYQRTIRHFLLEEDILFPEFEAMTGETMGPTQVMRMEHSDMRYQLEELKNIFEKKEISKDLVQEIKNILESLLFILQQHNLKKRITDSL